MIIKPHTLMRSVWMLALTAVVGVPDFMCSGLLVAANQPAAPTYSYVINNRPVGVPLEPAAQDNPVALNKPAAYSYVINNRPVSGPVVPATQDNAVALNQPEKSKKKRIIQIGLAVTAVLAGCGGMLFLLLRYKKQLKFDREQEEQRERENDQRRKEEREQEWREQERRERWEQEWWEARQENARRQNQRSRQQNADEFFENFFKQQREQTRYGNRSNQQSSGSYVPKSNKLDEAYKAFDVDKNASYDDIKSKYKKFALQYHPDKSQDPNASEKFRTIQEHYETIKKDRGIK